MKKTDGKSLAAVEFELQWNSDHGTHTDCFFAEKVNFWRDILPKPLFEKLMNRNIGDCVEHSFGAGQILPGLDPSKRFRIRHSQFEGNFRTGTIVHPRQGRFYPKGILKDIANVFRANIEPFRCAEVTDSGILVDFSHPLSGIELRVKAFVRDIMTGTAGMGGACNDWMQILTAGPGMQVRWNGQPTDFFSDKPFERSDQLPDGQFYEKPRFVNHLDDTAIAAVSGLYGQMLHDGDRVLDLMSSWTSHLPSRLTLKNVTGLGLNPEELNRNKRLTRAVIHDLNENPVLPFDDASFDAVICTVSVEYLTKPVAVFKDVGRILRPGGCFAATFSNRWFPPKAVNVWQQIHEFERLGLVSEYFLLSGPFRDIHTYSVQGRPRPEGDKYYGELSVSDPVFGVWAYRR
jgi:SAM-dependent methyltransferase